MLNQTPFYENPDNTHCFQAVFRMILKYYWPDKDYSWEKLEKITAKVEGLWTWPIAGMLWLHNNGFEVRTVKAFDYKEFVSKGSDYLISFYGEQVGRSQIAHSDINQEIQYARRIVEVGLCEARIPDASELKRRLDENYLLICNVNSRALDGRDGYAGHFVLLIGYDKEDFIMHDPGRPGVKNRRVPFAKFEMAWAYPGIQAKNYIAVQNAI
jgi:hypothetical protein